METEEIIRQKRLITERFGEWTNHNIQLDRDVYTVGQKVTGAEVKLRRILQAIADLVDRPLEKLRILDLACLEGLYSIEMALHGAEVVAIEGRETNIAKARFAKDILALDNLVLVQDDVRNLSREKYGSFDVVLCLGIFYHLDAPDVFLFMEKIAEVCQKLLILDTHVSPLAEKSCVYKQQKYWGGSYIEHSPETTPEEKAKSLWASLDNTKSFWLTRYSLYNLLSDVGFTSVYECHYPPVIKYEIMKQKNLADRNTFVGIKGQQGQQQKILSSAIAEAMPVEKLPEKER